MRKKIIIAIDGYSSCGKSTIARQLAGKLSYKYIDTGAMYRAVTFSFLRQNIQIDNAGAVEAALKEISIDFSYDKNTGTQYTRLNKINVEEDIRGWDVTERVSEVSTLPAVRHKLVKIQQEFGNEKGIIMDGRDIGTKVFPDAELKIFITADPNVRAERRFKELLPKNPTITLSEVKENLTMRDMQDTTRKESPLSMAADARKLDNTIMTPEEQLKIVYQWAIDAKKKHSQANSTDK